MSLLEIRNLQASYGRVPALHGVDVVVDEGQVVVVLGANGAGKTTLLRAVCGLVDRTGEVTFDGEELIGQSTDSIVRRGVAHVPQGRGTFADLSVRENLELGAFVRRDRSAIAADRDYCFELFPRLEERSNQTAGELSGGEQQMLAVARAIMLRPRLMLLDEPSLGLAPLLIRDLFDALRAINEERGTTMLVVEQNANLALDIAGSAYVLEAGLIRTSGPAHQLREDDQIRRAYLGH